MTDGTPEPQAGRRRALLLACGDYDDPTIPPLRSPQRDADELADVLGDRARGRYQVQKSVNCTADQARVAIEQFLSEGRRTDLVLLYFSCHGMLDSRNELHLAFRNTQQHLLQATGLSREWVHARLNESRAQSSIVLVDCCFSGSFVHGGSRARAAQRPVDVDGLIRNPPPGKARAVLTASTATQLSFEDDAGRAIAAARPSYFTEAVIAALRTGAADRDRDGEISVDDLYSFVYDRVLRSGHGQEPQRSIYGGGDLVVGYAEEHAPEPPLPPEPPASDFRPQTVDGRLAPWPPLPAGSAPAAPPFSGRTSLDGLLEERPPAGVGRPHRSVVTLLAVVVAVVAVLGVGAVGARWTLSSARSSVVVPSPTSTEPSPVQPSVTKDRTSPASARPTSVRTSARPAPGVPLSTAAVPPTVPSGFRQVEGPGPLTVAIPESWVVGPAKVPSNLQGTDPADSDRFVRYGGNPSPSESLLDVNLDNARSSAKSFMNYRLIRLEPVAYGTAVEAVDWEYVFNRDDGQERHVLRREWRINGTDFVVYASAPGSDWTSVRRIFDIMLQTASPR